MTVMKLQTGSQLVRPITETRTAAALTTMRPTKLASRWQGLIDNKLLAWLNDPRQLADEGIDAPTQTIIRLAIDFAERWRDEGRVPPDQIIPDPNGGIIFERKDGQITEAMHVWDDGQIEYFRFRGTKLEIRNVLTSL